MRGGLTRLRCASEPPRGPPARMRLRDRPLQGPGRVCYLSARLGELPDGTRVLIVEDDGDIRRGLAELFLEEGYAVETASDGAEGLRVAGTFRPELVLLDLAMPVMDGLRFLERWRAAPATADVPVIVLTARHAVELPPSEILVSKPFDVGPLLALVQRTIGSTRVARSVG